jgi:hypothetical protein
MIMNTIANLEKRIAAALADDTIRASTIGILIADTETLSAEADAAATEVLTLL